MRILIADDNEPVRRYVRELLTSESSLEVCGEAVDGAEAIQKTVELRPDLVVLDISMPVFDGLAVARTLRTDAPHTRILIMSQHDPSMLLPRALQAGAHACVDKSRLGVDLLPTALALTNNFGRNADLGIPA
jgi:two-component system, NarL family, response regulator NreC